jgi:hypothetical protein
VWVALVMGLVFTVLIAYPFIEKRLTGDSTRHNLLQRPRDAPGRTSIGALAIPFYLVLTFACDNDIIALNATTRFFRIRAIDRAATGVFPGLPSLYQPAAQRSSGARARHRNRSDQAPAAWRVYRGAPAAGSGRLTRPPGPAAVPAPPTH